MGAFTTFSTFTVETVHLAEDGEVDVALHYAAGSFLVGLGAAALWAGLTAAA
jgi:fluoride ion exporter CrcB/FEX